MAQLLTQSTSDTQISDITILIVDDDELVRKSSSLVISRLGYQVLEAEDGYEALEIITVTQPDLIILDIAMPVMDGLELLRRLRSHPDTQAIPVILFTARSGTKDEIEGLELGADDYLSKPIDLNLLQARVQAKLKREAIKNNPSYQLEPDGIFKWELFRSELGRELFRLKHQPTEGFVAIIELHGLNTLTNLLGNRILPTIEKQVHTQILFDKAPLEIVTVDDEGRFLLLMPQVTQKQAKQRLVQLTQRLLQADFVFNIERVRFTPIMGFTPLDGNLSVDDVLKHLHYALEDSQKQIDLDPKLYLGTTLARLTARRDKLFEQALAIPTFFKVAMSWKHTRTLLQIGITFLVGIVVPLMLYLSLWAVGIDITWAVYIGVIIALLLTAALIWYEGYLALKQEELPEPATSYPLCSAIIAAYLPNEADTVMATIDAFLNVDYTGPIQVILAYNTPEDMPIEDTLKALAKRDPRFQPIRIEHSTSKAQNVNAALEHVTGEFVGIFDADHQPEPDAFTRAWCWLSQGYGVVQGHCLIRNGETNWVTRLIAVEFEAMYAVAHPGRAQMHGFGIFGGSNGYWLTDLLRKIRMHGFMLTEDIDSSMRVTSEGYGIKVDPHIISRELAPSTLGNLWNQRMRWAQGWFQVSLKHALNLLRSDETTWQQKFGIWHLVVWREIYPWISLQIIPIILFWAIRNGGFQNIDWFVPIFVVTTIVTIGTGPAQIYYIYRNSHESIKQRKGWFVFYVIASLFYTEYKNTIARVSQVKEVLGERRWKVTPRE